jgi:hypothetical protein
MGHGAWGMGQNNQSKILASKILASKIPNAQCPMPNAQHPKSPPKKRKTRFPRENGLFWREGNGTVLESLLA